MIIRGYPLHFELTLSDGKSNAQQITIFRGEDDQVAGKVGGEVDMLEPGDLVQVTLQPPDMAPPTGSISAGEPTGLPRSARMP